LRLSLPLSFSSSESFSATLDTFNSSSIKGSYYSIHPSSILRRSASCFM